MVTFEKGRAKQNMSKVGREFKLLLFHLLIFLHSTLKYLLLIFHTLFHLF